MDVFDKYEFDLSEVARIVDMPVARAQGWTIGRPLKITPSVRDSGVKGSRKLFSKGDVYLMGFANELWKAGFTAKAIKRVMDKLAKTNIALDDASLWGLALHMRGLDTEIEPIRRNKWSINLGKTHGSNGSTVPHIVDIAVIRAWVDGQIKRHVASKD